jgi:hypothetical protein
MYRKVYVKSSKGVPRQAEVALGVSGYVKAPDFLTFGTTRVVVRQLYAPAAFTPGKIPALPSKAPLNISFV